MTAMQHLNDLESCFSGIHVALSHGDMTMTDNHVPVVMEDVTDPEELAKAQAQREASIATPRGCKHTLRRFTRATAASAFVSLARNCLSRTYPKKF